MKSDVYLIEFCIKLCLPYILLFWKALSAVRDRSESPKSQKFAKSLGHLIKEDISKLKYPNITNAGNGS